VPRDILVTLAPREHTRHVWLPYREAADRCSRPPMPRRSCSCRATWPPSRARRDGTGQEQEKGCIDEAACCHIQHPQGRDLLAGRPRILALKQALAQLDPDILFLQEVQGRHDLNALRHASNWPQQGQHEYLAGDTHHAAYGMNAVYDHGHHGNALISRFEIASIRNQDVSDHAYESRGILHCVVPIEGVEVHCYVIHLGLFAGAVGARSMRSFSGEHVLAARCAPADRRRFQ
jgi:hypothetical protein